MASQSFLSRLTGSFKRPPAGPEDVVGAGGTVISGGFIHSHEKDGSLTGTARYTTFGNLLANTSIVAAGVRYFLNLVADADWKVEPSDPENDRAVKLAEKIEFMMRDMETPWHRVVRRAAMYRFYGFSLQEWVAKRNIDSDFGFEDIAPRPQQTIRQWDVDHKCRIQGVVQEDVNAVGLDLYIPRSKIIYLVDDTLNDSPEGLGLFRHLVEPNTRLKAFQQLEMTGYESDLRGVPFGRVPYGLLTRLVNEGKLTPAARDALVQPVENFIQNHVRSVNTGIVLDSAPYTGQDEAATPSRIHQWEMELMRGEGAGVALKEIATAIDRLQREMARILGVEQFLLGGGERGSFALSKDKTQAFLLMVNATLNEITKQFEKDFITRVFELNGWDMKLKPTLKAENVQFRNISEMSAALRDLGQAGVILSPKDPAVAELFDMMGLTRPTGEGMVAEEEMVLLQSELDNVMGQQQQQQQQQQKPKGNEDK